MKRVCRLALFALACFGCDGAPASAEDPSVAITPLTLPRVQLERADGTRAPLRAASGPVLLHFWATWCVPCRRELPVLLAEAAQVEGLEVIAVTDEPWDAVRAHFGGEVPPVVARDSDASLARALGVSSLPDTYLVDRRGVARRRVAGPRDWTDAAHAAWLRSAPP